MLLSYLQVLSLILRLDSACTLSDFSLGQWCSCWNTFLYYMGGLEVVYFYVVNLFLQYGVRVAEPIWKIGPIASLAVTFSIVLFTSFFNLWLQYVFVFFLYGGIKFRQDYPQRSRVVYMAFGIEYFSSFQYFIILDPGGKGAMPPLNCQKKVFLAIKAPPN